MVGCLVWKCGGKKPTKGCRDLGRRRFSFLPLCFFSPSGKASRIRIEERGATSVGGFFFGLGLVGLGSEGGKGQGIKFLHDLGGNI